MTFFFSFLQVLDKKSIDLIVNKAVLPKISGHLETLVVNPKNQNLLPLTQFVSFFSFFFFR